MKNNIMNNLLQFKTNELSPNEQINVKGGMRLVTTDKEVFKAKKKELKQQNLPFTKMKEKDPVTGIKTFCIEW